MKVHKKLYGIITLLLALAGIGAAILESINYLEVPDIIVGALSCALLIIGIWIMVSKNDHVIAKLQIAGFLILAAGSMALFVGLLIDGIGNLGNSIDDSDAKYAQVPTLIAADVKKVAEQNNAYPLVDGKEIVSKVQLNDVLKKYDNKVTLAGRGYVTTDKNGKKYVKFWTNENREGITLDAEYMASDEQMAVVTQENNYDIPQEEFDAQGVYHYIYGEMIITAEITDVVDNLFSTPVFKGKVVDIYAK